MKSKKWLELLVAGIAILTVVMLLTSITGAAPAKDTTNIGIVDMEKLQNELPDFQDLKSLVKEKENGFKHFQGYLLSQHRAALKEIQDKATSDKNGKKADEQAEIEKRFQDDVKKKSEETNDKLEKERSKIMQELNEVKKKAEDDTRKLITEVAADQKLSVVLDKNAVLFGGTDITGKVIEKAKKDAKNESKKDSKPTKK